MSVKLVSGIVFPAPPPRALAAAGVNQCREQHGSKYLRHVSLLAGTTPGELIASDLIKMRSSHDSQAINGSMRTKVQ